MSWPLDVEPAPRLLVLPPAAADLGEAEAAIELWEHYSRKTLDATQRLVVYVMMAQAADGRWAARTTGREMPRQNGKGDEIEVVELWGLVQRGEAILHTVHDAVLLASQTQQRMLGVLEGHADLRRKVKRKWQGTGQQMIELRNGGVIWYRTRTGGGGRGVDDISRLVVDEAQHATEDHLAAISPTLLANPDPQLNALGTAGIAGVSTWWWRQRRRALSDDPGAFGYIGHTAEVVRLDGDRVAQDPVDVEDRDLWRSSNPAMGAGRGGGMEFLEEQYRVLGPESFAREHLGVWDPPDEVSAGSVIDPDAWTALLLPGSGARPSPVALSVEMSSDRRWTLVGLAGRLSGEERYLQVVDSRRGTGWIVDRVVELVERHSPVGVVVDGSSPAASLVPALEVAGVDVRVLSQREVARGCGLVYDGIVEATVRHAGGALLDRAVASVQRRSVGDAFVWSEPTGADCSPLRAVTNALYGLVSAPEPKRKRTGVVQGIR